MKTAYYKYRPLYQIGSTGSPEPHPFTKSIFEKAEIFYSAPKHFNDPYDCNLKLHVRDSTDAEWENYCDQLVAQYPAEKAKMDRVKSGKLWRTNPSLTENVGTATHQENYEQSSIFCLSKKGNSIPMFSYYADSHKGIAIEFQFSDDEVPCGIPFNELNHRGVPYAGKIVLRDVEYPDTFPELNYHRLYGKDQLVRSLMFTKHHKWSHEEEFRIFRRKVPASSVQFEKRLLTRVIFGSKTTQDDVDLVKSWLLNWPSDIVLAKAETAIDQFELVIKDFDLVKGATSP